MEEIDIYCFGLKSFISEEKYIRCTNCEVCITSYEMIYGDYDKRIKLEIRNKKLESL